MLRTKRLHLLITLCVDWRLLLTGASAQAIGASLQKIWKEKSQHTDFNEDTTNKRASVACGNVRL